jgi:hypothetical protein
MIAFHQIFEVKTENLNQPVVATNNNNQHKVDIGSVRGRITSLGRPVWISP